MHCNKLNETISRWHYKEMLIIKRRKTHKNYVYIHVYYTFLSLLECHVVSLAILGIITPVFKCHMILQKSF